MKNFTINKYLFKTIFIITIMAVLVVTFTACQDMGFPSTTEETPEPESEPTGPTIINTKDAAIMAVYQRLLGQAGSYDAKIYLSDFYANCDNWTAQSEYFKDGSGTWYVVVDMTENRDWELRPHWQQASWFVFRDGEVIPSNHFQANALRIEADLQALTPEDKPEED